MLESFWTPQKENVKGEDEPSPGNNPELASVAIDNAIQRSLNNSELFQR